jgi:hypothetical protein
VIRHAARLLLRVMVTVAAGRPLAWAQAALVTGNPAIDVPAIQAALDRGRQVILTGHFSFDVPPAIPSGRAFNAVR